MASVTKKLHPQLEAVRSELVEATARARRVGNVRDAAFASRPAPGAWSAAECIAHLNVTTMAYLPLIDEALAGASPDPRGDSASYRKDLVGRFLAWTLEPPYRMKVKTSAPFVPSADKPRDELLGEFERLQAELERRVEASNGFDLGSVKVTSPFSARMKYNLLSAYGAILAHERRHLWQAERALEAVERAG